MSKNIYKITSIVVCIFFLVIIEAWAGGTRELGEPEPGMGVLVYRVISHPGTSVRWTRELFYRNRTTGRLHSVRFPADSRTSVLELPAGHYEFENARRYDRGKLDRVNDHDIFIVHVQEFSIYEGAIIPYEAIPYYFNTGLPEPRSRRVPAPREIQNFPQYNRYNVDHAIQTRTLKVDPVLEREMMEAIRDHENAHLWRFAAIHDENLAYWPGNERIAIEPQEAPPEQEHPQPIIPAGVPHHVLTDSAGRSYAGGFRDGLPHGTGVFFDGAATVMTEFDSGVLLGAPGTDQNNLEVSDGTTKTLLEFFLHFESNVEHYEINPEGTGLVLVREVDQSEQVGIHESIPTVHVEGGTFRMGSTDGSHANEGPVRNVTVSSFRIAQTETTVEQFRSFVSATGYLTDAETSDGGFVWTGTEWERRADATWRNPYLEQTDTHPVVLVSWFDAVAYANWLSAQDGLSPAYRVRGRDVTWNREANGWRLPTEAEWEFAARGGTRSEGFVYAGGDDADAVAWYDGNSGNSTRPAGEQQANELGLYDMSGNVLEWVWDWRGEYRASTETDPAGPSSGEDRVIRGGSWAFDASFLRSTNRSHVTPLWDNHVGFRLVRSVVVGSETTSEQTVEQVERTQTVTRVGRDGLSVERTDETITRRAEPVSRVQFGTGSVDGSLSLFDGGSALGLGAGLGYRGFNNRGENLPGPEGGRGSGLDYQFFTLAKLTFLNYEVTTYDENLERERKTKSDTLLNLSLGARIGWTWYNFNRMDQTDLTQSGRGFTLGLQGMVLFNPTTPDNAPGYSSVMFVPAPSFSFDRYEFNPATSKYRARSFYFFIWPVPFNAMVSYSFSL
jgi:formylglycine-generating enzyme required for sulfatase activity